MARRTDEVIAAEIKNLEEVKPRVPSHTAFGDSNHKTIDAQIVALKERMDEDSVYRLWPDENEMDLASNVIDAIAWMNEDEDEPPSAGWVELADMQK